MAQEPHSDSGNAVASEQRKRLGGGAIATLTGVGLLVVVVIQNTQRVSIDFLFWSFTLPIWLFALAMAVVGALVWFGTGVLRRHRRRQTRRG